MLKKFHLFIKYQSVYLAQLLIFLVLPLAAFFEFSIYPLPKIQYFVLGYLILFQYAFYNEKKYLRKITPKVTGHLQKELKRTPSLTEINSLARIIAETRQVTIIIVVLMMITVMIYYKEF